MSSSKTAAARKPAARKATTKKAQARKAPTKAVAVKAVASSLGPQMTEMAVLIEKTLRAGRLTPTDIMMMANGMLRSGNLQIFELGMWQSWTGD